MMVMSGCKSVSDHRVYGQETEFHWMSSATCQLASGESKSEQMV
jgi:hypothetical protein